jgi:hypothetical protein
MWVNLLERKVLEDHPHIVTIHIGDLQSIHKVPASARRSGYTNPLEKHCEGSAQAQRSTTINAEGGRMYLEWRKTDVVGIRQNVCRQGRDVLLLTTLAALSISRAWAQSEPAAPDNQPDGEVERIEEITVDEEITVIGQRSLRLLRLEVQLERERVYGLFNSLNSDDQFDIHCRNAPRTGTRIPQRVCRPQYADNAAGDAGEEFVRRLQFDCVPRETPGTEAILSEACMAGGISRAQAVLSEVPVKDQQLDAEFQRLARDSAEFRHAIVDNQIAERRYEEARRIVASGLRVVASIIDSDRAEIPSSLNLRRDDIVAPRPIELAAPQAPWSDTDDAALREGWVKLRFSVQADGTTADVRVVDTMPPDLDASRPATAAEAWTFEPATTGGAPIDWHNELAIVTVRRERAVHEGWADFADAYEAVAALAAGSRYEEAKLRNVQMRDELAATLEEMAFAEMQIAGIEHTMGNPHAALEAIRRATEPAVEQLADEELKLALEHRFALAPELGFVADALATYERRLALGRVPSREPMARNAAALEQALGAPETNLVAQARIGASERREHALIWPVFAVGEVDGRVDGLGLVCNRNKASLPFEADVQMIIPAGWSDCTLLVEGRPETSFVVYELREPVN